MPRPLALELRQRVVDAYNNGEGTYRELAARFQVGEASVSRWLRRSREGRLEGSVKGPEPQKRRLKDVHRAFLRDAIDVLPDSTAPELVAALKEEFGLEVSESTVKRERRRLGYTPKRGSQQGAARGGPT